jgi:hypothetical protein
MPRSLSESAGAPESAIAGRAADGRHTSTPRHGEGSVGSPPSTSRAGAGAWMMPATSSAPVPRRSGRRTSAAVSRSRAPWPACR